MKAFRSANCPQLRLTHLGSDSQCLSQSTLFFMQQAVHVDLPPWLTIFTFCSRFFCHTSENVSFGS